MTAQFVMGIDLGTTNCALAQALLHAETSKPEIVPIPQLVAQGEIDARPLLPSFLYLAHESEGAQPLPWDRERRFAVGEYARARGTDAPSRLISSAKSWLCHPGVDRRGGILPLGAPEDVEKISPVETSWRFLEHLSEAWNVQHPDTPFAEQEIVLTVPASFDASARDLTVEAAYASGIENLTLLEEPQAALYAWIDALGEAWRKQIHPGDIILVVDVGGGTTDLSAIAAIEREGSLELARVAVGDHILLGGDNMDLALAHQMRGKLADEGKQLDRWQMIALAHACRSAKEYLLSHPTADSAPIAIASRGARLLGSTLRTELTQEEVQRTILEGFFPRVSAGARPTTRARAALTQLGLPYASDAAVTRHLAAFLGRQAQAIARLEGFAAPKASERSGTLLHPTAVLFNGGVMKSSALCDRVVEVLNGWLKEEGAAEARVLAGSDLDLAVARGAAAYGRVREGRGLRIRGGTARAYYVGIESPAPAVPGVEPPLLALCVAPFGMEEGTEASLPEQEFGAVVGEPVRFRFFGSSVRRQDKAGDELEEWSPEEVSELPPIEVTLPSQGRAEGQVVPVRLRAAVTEVGTLQLEALPREPSKPDERWKVELSVRAEE